MLKLHGVIGLALLITLAGACGSAHTTPPPQHASAAAPEVATEDLALDGVWVELRWDANESSAEVERYEFHGAAHTLVFDGRSAERTSRQRAVSPGKFLVSWREPGDANCALVVDLANRVAFGAAPLTLSSVTPATDGAGSGITRGQITGFGLIDGGDVSLPPNPATQTNPAWEEDTFFDGQTLSYTYENGKSFNNEFRGEHRFTMTRLRGRLDEVSVVRALGGGSFLVSWVDTNLGHIAQVIDLQNQTVHAAVPLPGRSEIWRASITRMPEPISAP